MTPCECLTRCQPKIFADLTKWLWHQSTGWEGKGIRRMGKEMGDETRQTSTGPVPKITKQSNLLTTGLWPGWSSNMLSFMDLVPSKVLNLLWQSTAWLRCALCGYVLKPSCVFAKTGLNIAIKVSKKSLGWAKFCCYVHSLQHCHVECMISIMGWWCTSLPHCMMQKLVMPLIQVLSYCWSERLKCAACHSLRFCHRNSEKNPRIEAI